MDIAKHRLDRFLDRFLDLALTAFHPEKTMDIAKHRLDHGARWPYDGGPAFWEDSSAPMTAAQLSGKTAAPAKDWAHAAARGVLADLSDRRGIKWELEKVDHEVRAEMTESLAEIIRLAHKEAR
ncbi:MAG: hypothetical protein ACK5OQ_16525 [Burkholderiales bacterium]|jgi:hypothetical protein